MVCRSTNRTFLYLLCQHQNVHEVWVSGPGIRLQEEAGSTLGDVAMPSRASRALISGPYWSLVNALLGGKRQNVSPHQPNPYSQIETIKTYSAMAHQHHLPKVSAWPCNQQDERCKTLHAALYQARQVGRVYLQGAHPSRATAYTLPTVIVGQMPGLESPLDRLYVTLKSSFSFCEPPPGDAGLSSSPEDAAAGASS